MGEEWNCYLKVNKDAESFYDFSNEVYKIII